MIRYGIIGTGGMAAAHARGTRGIDGVELSACCDIDADRARVFAAEHGFARSVTRVEDLLEACDAVAVVTPDAFHAPLSLQVLGAGKHLMCEKPLTTTFEDAQEVAAAARAAHAAGIVTFINFTYRDASAWQEARRLAADGAIGEVRHATGRYFQAWLASNVWGNWTQENHLWRCGIPRRPDGSPVGPAAGGTLGDVGCHILDFLTGVAGPATALRCSVRSFPAPHPTTGAPVTEWEGRPLDANSSVAVELDLDGGGLGLVESTRWASGHPNQVALGVYGTLGSLEIDLEDSPTRLRHCLGEARHRAAWTSVDVAATPSNFQRFIRSIQTGEQDQADVLRGAEIQACLEACDRSVRAGGTRVPIPSLFAG
ncbi:Gfo/Idh/MocA family protein [Phycisphaera mikurensis]|uniref:Oxidoreductase n=1 Tax=Phycisphaera mikurensis (strain NBRC 102666 / KCTC 22515 / FYK2301M01) TaxID=1142394 RepID=I0IFC0_PHYMF|nr:Gfo/Idh/MocA family oxidoreductase [Phycisphaera mikurensis]MBB6440649.1 putative dehydrogenase [Phycisphaera mikurensis]BAM03958.1 hypothetical protein PSMK_17990 [Phycisphaera mikurensis NBRC 102666]